MIVEARGSLAKKIVQQPVSSRSLPGSYAALEEATYYGATVFRRVRTPRPTHSSYRLLSTASVRRGFCESAAESAVCCYGFRSSPVRQLFRKQQVITVDMRGQKAPLIPIHHKITFLVFGASY